MNKWIAIILPIISVLAIGVLVLGVIFFRETNKLNDAQAEIVTLESNISSLEAKVSTLEADLAATEVEASALEAELLATFPDANLEIAIRGALGNPQGPIYKSALEAVTTLEALGLEFFGLISDLTGLEYCTNLEGLNLAGNNDISDISALAGLSNLQNIYLADNNISDISALAGLTNLQELSLWGNDISDISPLVANSGLSAGDIVNLSGNPLSTTSVDVYIPQLEERGVNIIY
jgi:outer membrane murein-binding lipoprotein Lpp